MNYSELTKEQIKQVKKELKKELSFFEYRAEIKLIKKTQIISWTAFGDIVFELGFYK
jgi:hypothetical protein